MSWPFHGHFGGMEWMLQCQCSTYQFQPEIPTPPTPYPCFSQGWRFQSPWGCEVRGCCDSSRVWKRPFAPSLSRSACKLLDLSSTPDVNNLDLRALKAGTCQEGRGASQHSELEASNRVMRGYGLPWENDVNGEIGGRGKESKTQERDLSQVFLKVPCLYLHAPPS